MTPHISKGLEFQAVNMLELENGVLGSWPEQGRATVRTELAKHCRWECDAGVECPRVAHSDKNRLLSQRHAKRLASSVIFISDITQ